MSCRICLVSPSAGETAISLSVSRSLNLALRTIVSHAFARSCPSWASMLAASLSNSCECGSDPEYMSFSSAASNTPRISGSALYLAIKLIGPFRLVNP